MSENTATGIASAGAVGAGAALGLSNLDIWDKVKEKLPNIGDTIAEGIKNGAKVLLIVGILVAGRHRR